MIVGQSARRDIVTNLEADISNIAHNYLWNSADWRETKAVLPPFWLQPGEQDHGAPENIVPSDFLGLREAYCADVTSGPDRRYPLILMSGLALTHVIDWPRDIEYRPETATFRLFPRVPDTFAATRYMIEGVYKKRPTKITAANIAASTIPWDDAYYHVFIAVWTWAMYVASGDQRAGNVVTDTHGRRQVTGQLAVAETLIAKMIDQEGINLGSPGISPREGLALGSIPYSAIYPAGW